MNRWIIALEALDYHLKFSINSRRHIMTKKSATKKPEVAIEYCTA